MKGIMMDVQSTTSLPSSLILMILGVGNTIIGIGEKIN